VTRVGIFGWGVVAPRSPDIDAFATNLDTADSWLTPFNGFGASNFLAGAPDFRFADYREWIAARFPPRRFAQLEEKMDSPSLYAIGAFIQALRQNPGLEATLQELGLAAHVYVGTGLGNIGKIYDASVTLDRVQRRWDRFWSEPQRNSALQAHLAEHGSAPMEGVPPAPAAAAAIHAEPEDRQAAVDTWHRYWADRSPELGQYLAALAEIEKTGITGSVDSGKMHAIRARDALRNKLQQQWNAPDAPWEVTADVVWNIHNTPAAQISMLGKIRGLSFAPVAACSTFGVALKLAMDAIQRGEAKAVVVGATDPPPHPLIVGGFFSARVLAADGRVSLPLTRLQGTHVAGGSVVWILGDLDFMKAKGYEVLGMEPIAVGVSSDADHIITPTVAGPTAAIEQALGVAGARPEDIGSWDMHATATPGDYNEVKLLNSALRPTVLGTARKGTFGHGMSAGSGWELTAQYLGYARGRLYPTALPGEALNPAIQALHGSFVLDKACAVPGGLAGKLSLGVGGINACVISKPW